MRNRIPRQLPSRPTGIAAGLALLAFLGFSRPASDGCALCADIPGASGALGPRLLETASAIQHEIDSGGLERNPAPLLPTSGRALGYRMARLLEGHPDLNHRFELILIDSGARFYFDPADPARGFVGAAKESSTPPARRWITGLDVFHALLDGRLQVDTATVRGILRIESAADPAPLAAVPAEPAPTTFREADPEAPFLPAPGRPLNPILLVAVALLVLAPVLLVLRSNRPTRAPDP